MTDLSAHVRAVLSRVPPPPRYWIAYSGGMDSHVLLCLIAQLRQHDGGFPEIRAIHVHHGLLPQADAWAAHCERICAQLHLPFEQVKVDASAKAGESPEEAARNARYRAIERRLGPSDVLLTAQHRDDQAETVLLQLLRGAGLAGLSAMPDYQTFGPGHLCRPLLAIPRDALRTYAVEHRLQWVDDPSNLCLDYDRNYLRQHIIPQLQRRWPGLSKTLARTAGHCADAQQRLQEMAGDLYRSCLRQDGRTLDADQLRSFSASDQRLVVRTWLADLGYRMPSSTVIERVIGEVLTAGRDRMPIVAWREGQIRRFRGGLFVLPADMKPPAASKALRWDNKAEPLMLENNGQLDAESSRGDGIRADAWQGAAIEVRYRRGGETARLANRGMSHTLKNLLHDAGLPPWIRDRVPLIYLDGQLAAIAGLWTVEPFQAKPGEASIKLTWRPTI